MRRMAWRGTVIALVLGLAWGTAPAAEKDTYQSAKPAKKSRWWWPFGRSKEEEPAKSAKTEKSRRSAANEANSADREPAVPKSPAPASALIANEQTKFLRRQQVCNRLRQLALEANDASLEKQVDVLEQRAWLIYEQHTQTPHLPGLLPTEESAAVSKITERSAKTDRPLRSVFARGLGVHGSKGE